MKRRLTHLEVVADERERVRKLLALTAERGQIDGWILSGTSLDVAQREIKAAAERALYAERSLLVGSGAAIRLARPAAVLSMLSAIGFTEIATAEAAARGVAGVELGASLHRVLCGAGGLGEGSHPREVAMIDLGLGRFSTGMVGTMDGQTAGDGLGGVLVDALRIITDHVWRSAAAWRRICRVVQVTDFRRRRAYLRGTGTTIQLEEVAESAAGGEVRRHGGGLQVSAGGKPTGGDDGWAQTAELLTVRERMTEIKISLHRLLSDPGAIGVEVAAAAQAECDALDVAIWKLAAANATVVAGADYPAAVQLAAGEIHAEKVGKRRLSGGSMRPVVVAAPDVGELVRSELAPRSENDRSRSVEDVVIAPSAPAGLVVLVSREFQPVLVSTFPNEAAPGAVGMRVIDYPDRERRQRLVAACVDRSDPVVWPAGAGWRRLRIA